MKRMNLLEQAGLKYLEGQLNSKIRRVVKELKTHITQEMERIIMPLEATLDRLLTAFTNELEQVRQEAAGRLSALEQELAESDSENTALQESLQTQVTAYEGLLASVDASKNRMEQVASDLEANDPPVEEPPAGGGGEEPPAGEGESEPPA